MLCPRTTRTGYLRLTVPRLGDRKPINVSVHRLVLLAFVGPCPPGMETRHLDGKPSNNLLSNLAWGTHTQNVRDMFVHGTKKPAAPSHRRSLDSRPSMLRLHRVASGWPGHAVAHAVGINASAYAAIEHGKKPPVLADGSWRPCCLLVAEIIGEAPEALWPECAPPAITESDAGAVLSDSQVASSESPEGVVGEIERNAIIANAIGTLRPREQAVLRRRFGIGGHGDQTLEEVGCTLGLSRERVRQIEAKALRKLRHGANRWLLHDLKPEGVLP